MDIMEGDENVMLPVSAVYDEDTVIKRQVNTRGPTLTRKMRERVWDLHKEYLEEEIASAHASNRTAKNMPSMRRIKFSVQQRVCSTLKLTRVSYYRIVREFTAAEARGEIDTSPGMKRPQPSPNINNLDGFTVDAIRRKIHNMYCAGELPTVSKLLSYAMEEHGFKGELSTFTELLKTKMGLRFKKVKNRKILMERHDVLLQRYEFLKKWKYHKGCNSPFVYLDETWVWENHATNRMWQSNGEPGSQAPIGKGERLVILHAGTENGFVPNAELSFVPDTDPADYQKDMTAELFTKWFSEQLLPNIPEDSVIVMSSAPYHCAKEEQIPTSVSRKTTMYEWLLAKGVTCADMSMLKAQLYDFVKQNKPSAVRYVIDELAKSSGHTVLRVPPYHCDLNPIEHLWSRVKNEVGEQNQTFNMTDVLHFTKEAIAACSPEVWEACVKQAEKLCDEYDEKDPVVEESIEKMIIELDGETEDSDAVNSDDDVNSAD